MTNHQPDTIDTKTPSSIPKSLQQRIDNIKDAEFQFVIAALINHYEPTSNLVHKKIKLTDYGSSIVELEVSLLLPARKKAVLKVYDSAIKVEYKDGESICERSDILKVLVMKHSDKADSSYLCFIPSAMDKQFVSNSAIVCLIPSTQLRLFTMFDVESSSAALDCYYKAKQGCLYMFQNLLFFGFKKPVFVLQFEILKSIQVTCVTQRTFNIEIILESEEVIEFGMVEQKLYDCICF